MLSKHSIALVFGAACAVFGAPLPCSLLTQAQVTAVLGANVGAGQPLAAKVCTWTAPPQLDKGINIRTVTLTLLNEQEFAAAKAPASNKITTAPVSGIGDEAIYLTTGKFISLAVKKGNLAFLLRMYGVPPDQFEAKEKALALDILSRQ